MDDFGILVFGHSRPLHIADVLESLDRQGAIGSVQVWIDGHQGVPDLKHSTDLVAEVVSRYPIAGVRRHNGMLGFRKLILHALLEATARFRHLLILEDDCFPTRNAVASFREQLAAVEGDDTVFSVYGHPFLVDAESGGTCSRFQGWGWGTTADKLRPYLERLIDCYSMPEAEYLAFVEASLTPAVLARLDVTPPRLPSTTLRNFFAWDETLALLTAMDNKIHKLTPERTIYNFGGGLDGSRFKSVDWYRCPPFNMIALDEVWDYF